jgi:hypothetical protein
LRKAKGVGTGEVRAPRFDPATWLTEFATDNV